MPKGLFIIEIDAKSKPSIRSKYFEENEEIDINDTLILQLRMGLSEKKLFNYISKEFSIVSFIEEFKKGKEAFNFICCIVLKPSDDPNSFRDSIKLASKTLLKNIEQSDEVFNAEVKKIYEEYFETPTIILNEKAIMEIIDMPSEQVRKLNMENKTNLVFRSHIINTDTVVIIITTAARRIIATGKLSNCQGYRKNKNQAT